jgi:hypothetical protein
MSNTQAYDLTPSQAALDAAMWRGRKLRSLAFHHAVQAVGHSLRAAYKSVVGGAARPTTAHLTN